MHGKNVAAEVVLPFAEERNKPMNAQYGTNALNPGYSPGFFIL